MDQIKDIIEKALNIIGFRDFSMILDTEGRKISIFINEGDWFESWVARLIGDLDHLIKVIARKNGSQPLFIDINNYKKERETIILNLAKAAAKKASMSKESIRLPAMNSYERRLIHAELASRPDVKTESEGEGSNRCVVVRPL